MLLFPTRYTVFKSGFFFRTSSSSRMKVVSWLTVRTAITIFLLFRSARREATTLDFPLPVGASIMRDPAFACDLRGDFEHVALAGAVFVVREVGVDAVHCRNTFGAIGFYGRRMGHVHGYAGKQAQC